MPIVREIMTEEVVKVPRTATVVHAAKRMADENVGTVIVVDNNDTPVGIVTDRTLTTGVIAGELDPKKTKMQDMMTKSPITTTADADVCDVVEQMEENEIRRMPVVDDDDAVVGVLSTSDVAKDHAPNCGSCAAVILDINSRYV
jgi:CBS domain-containing protein